MSNVRPLLRLAVVLAAPLMAGGCAAAIVGGIAAAGGAGYAANQERGVGGTANDFKIKTDIQNAWIKADPNLQADLNVTVYEGRTLLTGAVPSPQMKIEAKNIAGGVPGVRVVYDEVEVAPPESAWRSAKDAWISARVRSDLVFNGKVRSVNYTVETVNGSVYLIGSARSQAELDQATAAARYTPDVKRVVSYVEIRPGMPPGTQPPASPPLAATGPGPGSDAPAAAPTAPVEVQKL
jgi:osmotically-inducible protein OsmY